MSYSLDPIVVDATAFVGDPRTWLAAQARAHSLRWALIHADDGVNWGELRDDGLHLSYDAFPNHAPKLHARTLLRARLFSATGELLLWRTASRWQARLVNGQGEPKLTQQHILWGDQVEDTKDGFALLCEGREGLRHAVPLPLANLDKEKGERVVLEVQRSADVDTDKQAYIKLSWISSLTTHAFAVVNPSK